MTEDITKTPTHELVARVMTVLSQGYAFEEICRRLEEAERALGYKTWLASIPDAAAPQQGDSDGEARLLREMAYEACCPNVPVEHRYPYEQVWIATGFPGAPDEHGYGVTAPRYLRVAAALCSVAAGRIEAPAPQQAKEPRVRRLSDKFDGASVGAECGNCGRGFADHYSGPFAKDGDLYCSKYGVPRAVEREATNGAIAKAAEERGYRRALDDVLAEFDRVPAVPFVDMIERLRSKLAKGTT